MTRKNPAALLYVSFPRPHGRASVAEKNAFIRRIAECQDADEARRVTEQVIALYTEEPHGKPVS